MRELIISKYTEMIERGNKWYKDELNVPQKYKLPCFDIMTDIELLESFIAFSSLTAYGTYIKRVNIYKPKVVEIH